MPVKRNVFAAFLSLQHGNYYIVPAVYECSHSGYLFRAYIELRRLNSVYIHVEENGIRKLLYKLAVFIIELGYMLGIKPEFVYYCVYIAFAMPIHRRAVRTVYPKLARILAVYKEGSVLLKHILIKPFIVIAIYPKYVHAFFGCTVFFGMFVRLFRTGGIRFFCGSGFLGRIGSSAFGFGCFVISLGIGSFFCLPPEAVKLVKQHLVSQPCHVKLVSHRVKLPYHIVKEAIHLRRVVAQKCSCEGFIYYGIPVHQSNSLKVRLCSFSPNEITAAAAGAAALTWIR